MDTKWKKFSRSMGLRLFLNLLLIATIIIGIFISGKYICLGNDFYSQNTIYMYEDNELYGNVELQEEFKSAFKDVLAYTLEAEYLGTSKENSKTLTNDKKMLDEKWKHYKYCITFTTENGKEKKISNTNNTNEKLEDLPVCISYDGTLVGSSYLKDWRNIYIGEDTNYEWLAVNELMQEICSKNKNFASFIGEQVVTHLDIYKDEIMAFVNMNYDFTEEELQQLSYDIASSILSNQKMKDDGISVSVAMLLGTPQKYNITFAIEENYFKEIQNKYEKQYENYLKNKEDMEEELHVLFYAGIYDFGIFLFVFAALLYVCGRKSGSEKVYYLIIDKLFVEITILLEGVLFAMFCYFFNSIITNLTAPSFLDSLTIILLFGFIIWLMTQFIFSLARKIKGKQIFATSFLVKLGKKIIKFFIQVTNSGKITKTAVSLAIILPLIYGCIIIIYFLSFVSRELFLFLFLSVFLIISWIGLILFMYYKVRQFQKVYDGVERVKKGDIRYQIATDGSGMMKELASNINSLSDGLENAVNEMLKSERLKTELISNVSHDIKTPLTSIITYVDLLKKEEAMSEKAREYIEILDQKSQRLKYLTNDLFEAAKASSGAMTMELEILDLGSLVQQGIGEFAEKFEKNNLEVKNEIVIGNYFVKADGRLVWRIFENLMSNISKYALQNSRIYMNVVEEKESITFIVKNISAYELNISPEELMERFTRGDLSRNSEGSGLGLHIAKSLAELQYGKFSIEIDGDLFKAKLTLPKIEKEKN